MKNQPPLRQPLVRASAANWTERSPHHTQGASGARSRSRQGGTWWAPLQQPSGPPGWPPAVPGSWVLLIKPDEGLNESAVRVTRVSRCMGGDWRFRGAVVEFWSRKMRARGCTAAALRAFW